MAIKVKAIERNVAFEKGKEQWAYVMQADLYSQLTQSKVITEATVRSGLPKAVVEGAWGAIGEVIKAWATEGHSVAVPGLGTLRFGLRSQAVADVNKVSASLIKSRRVIFTPNTDIKQELASTAVSITCYDRNGKVVKQVTSDDKDDVEDSDSSSDKSDNTGDSGNTDQGGSGSTEQGGSGSTDQGSGGDGSLV